MTRVLRHRAAVALAALAIGSWALAGCTSVRSSLGTVDGGCFLALPSASAAVHHHGRLLGADLIAVEALRHREPVLYEAVRAAPGARVRRVCLVAFSGSYTSAAVDRPAGRPWARLAVVAVEYPHSRLLATVLVFRPPVRFGHPRSGPG